MPDFVRVARLADVPPDALLGVEVDGRPIVLANVDGEIHALDGLCTHQRGALAGGSLFDGCLMCPLHGGEFDARSGEAVTLPAIEPLTVHEVRVSDGEILVARRG